jgi:hypothetical protein
VHITEHVDCCGSQRLVVSFINIRDSGKIIDYGGAFGRFRHLVKIHDIANDHFLVASLIAGGATIKQAHPVARRGQRIRHVAAKKATGAIDNSNFVRHSLFTRFP